MPPQFVVAQVGHSGSAYIASVLFWAGVPCGHESWFNPLAERDDSYVGDSSWCSVAWLHDFQGIVFHQVREPLAVMSSLLGEEPRTAYADLRCRIIGGSTGDPVEDALRSWVIFNDRAEQVARQRWRVEDVDPELVQSVGAAVGIDVDPFYATEAFERVPWTLNAHQHPRELGWNDFAPGPWLEQAVDQADRYGYATP